MQFKLLVIVAVLLSGIYNTILNIVRLRSANNPTPSSVSDVFDADTYVKWKKYSAEHSVLNIVSDIVICLISVCMLFTDSYAYFASFFPSDIFWQLFAVICVYKIAPIYNFKLI
jgi:hypothetical protein